MCVCVRVDTHCVRVRMRGAVADRGGGGGGLKQRPDVSLAAFSFLFAEVVRYNHERVKSIVDLERRYNLAACLVSTRSSRVV